MKSWKRWLAVSALALTMAAPGAAAMAADDMGMMAPKVDYSKADMMTKDGMELVALRQLAESLGYTVTWDDMERSVTLTRGMTAMDDKSMTDKGMGDKGMDDKGMMDKNMTDKGMTDKSMADMYKVKIVIGSKTVTIAMKEQMLEYAPMILNNKTYVTKSFVDMYLANGGMMMK